MGGFDGRSRLHEESRLDQAKAALASAEAASARPDASTGPAPGSGRRAGVAGARGMPSVPQHSEGPSGPERDTEGDGDPYVVARAIVLRRLALAPRSRAELERTLRDKGCSDQVSREVLDRLTEVGLVDDQAYAEMLVRSKQATRGLARSGLAHELASRGIDRDTATAALAAVGEGSERAKAEELVAKKLATLGGQPPLVQARRLSAMLARKGYSSGLVYAVVRDAVNAAPEHQRD